MFRKKPTTDDLCRFFRIIRRYLNAGISAQKCVEHYGKICTKATLKSISQGLIRDLGNGSSFADALRKHTFFPSFVIELVSVGEKTGQLNNFLDEIVFFLEQENDIQKELASSRLKVFLLLGTAFVAFLIAGFVVIPKIGDLLMSIGADIPLITQIVIGAGTALRNNWIVFLIAAFVMIGAYIYAKKEYPERVEYFKLKLPFIGKILSIELQYKFCKIVALCDMAGDIPINKAFQYTSMAINNALLRTALQRAARDLENSGMQVATALEKADEKHVLKEDIFIMLRAGQETGQMPKILNEEAEEYRKTIVRLSHDIGDKISSTVIIPLMLFIGMLVVSVYLPLFSMMEAANV